MIIPEFIFEKIAHGDPNYRAWLLQVLKDVLDDKEPPPSSSNTETIAKNGSIRKVYYGTGEQPWDTMVRENWAHFFAAGNVLKYLRRVKDPTHDLESARRYFEWLQNLADKDVDGFGPSPVFDRLVQILTLEEFQKVK